MWHSLSKLAWLVTLVLGAKLFEICYHAYLARRGLDTAGEHFRRLRKVRLGKSDYPAWPISGPLSRFGRIGTAAACHLFRYRNLMLLQAAVVIFATDRGILLAGLIALITGVWVEILRLITDRLRFGSEGDALTLGTYFDPTFQASQSSPVATLSTRLRNVVRLFVQLVGLVTVTYAALYCGLDKITAGGAFAGIPQDAWKFLHLLYFSIVTIGTVGYGDIYPLQSCLLGRLLTASEILSGFAMFGIFVTCISLTFGASERR